MSTPLRPSAGRQSGRRCGSSDNCSGRGRGLRQRERSPPCSPCSQRPQPSSSRCLRGGGRRWLPGGRGLTAIARRGPSTARCDRQGADRDQRPAQLDDTHHVSVSADRFTSPVRTRLERRASTLEKGRGHSGFGLVRTEVRLEVREDGVDVGAGDTLAVRVAQRVPPIGRCAVRSLNRPRCGRTRSCSCTRSRPGPAGNTSATVFGSGPAGAAAGAAAGADAGGLARPGRA